MEKKSEDIEMAWNNLSLRTKGILAAAVVAAGLGGYACGGKLETFHGKAVGESHCTYEPNFSQAYSDYFEFQVAIAAPGREISTVKYSGNTRDFMICDHLPHVVPGDQLIVSGYRRGGLIRAETVVRTPQQTRTAGID